jgi:hypothetical protein
MSDISPDSLRKHGDWLRDHRCYAEADAMDEAADEIERLRALLRDCRAWISGDVARHSADILADVDAAAGGSSCS